ncbi:MAG: SusC/RagA family TonB-linked outer membrane protein, partial [Butyricimonas faecihominis]
MAKVDVNYKNFTLSFKIDGNMQDRKYTPKDVGLASYAYNTARSVNAYNEDGSLMYYQRVKNNETYDVPFSIINEREHTSDKITTEQSGLSVNLGYRFVPCLTETTFAYNVSHTEEQVYYGEETWYAADLRAKSRESGEVIASYTLLPKGGELRLNNTKSKSYNVRASLMFNKYLDKDQVHNLSASVIGELSSSRYTGFKITKRGYLPDRGMVFDIIDEKDEKGSPYKAYFNWLRT